MTMRTCRFLLLALVVSLLSSVCLYAQSSSPHITKIDPPNWWPELPSPMLLVHGENLDGAKFSVTGNGVSIAKSSISENGHWAFLWLDSKQAAAQTLKIHAKNAAGEASANFELRQRQPAAGRYQGFNSSDVMYLIMTDRFADGDASNNSPAENSTGTPYDRTKARGWHGGDFRGIEKHIDYLKGLGVTTIWTTPVYKNVPSLESYHGYSATDMYAVDPHFGSMEDYQHLAEALHRQGMKIVLDTVPNHVGPRHPWIFDPPTADWFHGTLAQHHEAKGDFSANADLHASPELIQETTNGWFANILPDLNQENPLVSQYLIQNSIWWIEIAGLDGLRIDTFPFVGRQFWHDFHAQIHAVYPHLTTVGEAFNPDPTITAFFAGGVSHGGIDTGLDTPFDFPVFNSLRQTLAHDAPMTKLAGVLRQDWLYPHPERLVTFLGNHDTVRFLSEPGSTPEKTKLGFGLIATLRGMPQIYSGDEIAMTGGEDPDNRHDFPGGFAGDTASAYTKTGRTSSEQEMVTWVSTLLHLRKQYPVLREGGLQDLFVDDSAFIFTRIEGDYKCASGTSESDGPILVALNNSKKERTIHLDLKETKLNGCRIDGKSLLSSASAAQNGNAIDIPLAPESFELYKLK